MHRSMTLILGLTSLTFGAAAYAVGTSSPAPLTNVGQSQSAKKSASEYNGYTQQEVDATVIHAEHAYQGKDVKEIHSHLQHVINCLVGPGGTGFDATVENPCEHMGKGALNDVPQNSNEYQQLNTALSEANNGLAKTTMTDAHKEAKKVLDDVEKVQSTYKQ